MSHFSRVDSHTIGYSTRTHHAEVRLESVVGVASRTLYPAHNCMIPHRSSRHEGHTLSDGFDPIAKEKMTFTLHCVISLPPMQRGARRWKG